MRALGHELAYAITMPFLIALTLVDQRWPDAVGRWDDFLDEVANVWTSRHRT